MQFFSEEFCFHWSLRWSPNILFDISSTSKLWQRSDCLFSVSWSQLTSFLLSLGWRTYFPDPVFFLYCLSSFLLIFFLDSCGKLWEWWSFEYPNIFHSASSGPWVLAFIIKCILPFLDSDNCVLPFVDVI